MPRNAEIKARVNDFGAFAERARKLAGEPRLLRQVDTFFATGGGRLKLRELDAENAELIYYERADVAGVKESTFFRSCICGSGNVGEMRAILQACHGAPIRIVKKERLLWIYRASCGDVRIHLDRVDGLGDYAELEAIVGPAQTAQDCFPAVRELMTALGIEDKDLVQGAYADLLAPR